MNLQEITSTAVARGIDLATAYTLSAEPWKCFGRRMIRKTDTPLDVKSLECMSDLWTNFFFQEVFVNHLQMGSDELDLGDQAIWHGIYTGTLCMRYAIEQSPGLDVKIELCMRGLMGHQSKHGEDRPRLIRGYDPRTGRWQDDASNDSLTGHFFGAWAALRWGPPLLQPRARQLIRNIADALIRDKYRLTKADGSPTSHGKLINGFLTDPLQSTLVLAIFTVAEKILDDKKYGDARHEIYSKYHPMIPYGKAMLGNKENWNDEHRAAIHLLILALEDKSPAMQDYTFKGLVRLWSIVDKRANVWVNALIAIGLGSHLDDLSLRGRMRDQAMLVLSEYELKDKRFNTEVDWRQAPIEGLDGVWKPEVITVAGKERASEPLPLWAIGKQDFVWQRHRFSIFDWTGNLDASSRYNGGDFLAAFYASKLGGVL